MSATRMAHRAYAPKDQSIRTSRSIEFEVIARITHRLKKAIQEKNTSAIIDAMYENRRLWNTLATDVASPGNKLPEDLRARIFFLAEFVTQHSRKVLRNEATAIPLLEVNALILGGLQSEGAVK